MQYNVDVLKLKEQYLALPWYKRFWMRLYQGN